MSEAPGHLYTRQEDIARMEALVSQLPDEAVVELHLTDGGSITGVVTTRPSVQVFRDGDGHEGFNEREAAKTAEGGDFRIHDCD